MDITRSALDAVFTGLSTAFNNGFASTESDYLKITLETPSTTAQNEYPRLDEVRGLREWVGDRVFQDLSATSFTIKNKTFEGSIAIKREKIEDDSYGIFAPIAAQLGQNAARFPDALVFGLLSRGDQETGPDGQNFFDTDHPGYDTAGNKISVSNIQPGPGPAWYLMDTRNIFKPMIFQKRRKFALTVLTSPGEEHVFLRNEYLYGVDGRCNVGFGMYQLAYMSRQPLTPENFELARVAMTSHRKADGSPISVTPNLLVVPGSLHGAALRVAKSELVAQKIGDQVVAVTNPWAGSVEVLATSWL